MKDNYLRISSLEDDSVLLRSHRRSKSSSYSLIGTRRNERADSKIDLCEQIAENKNLEVTKGKTPNYDNYEKVLGNEKFQKISNTNLSNEINQSESVNFSLHSNCYHNYYDKTYTNTNNQNSSVIKYKINPSNLTESEKVFKEYVEKEKYDILKLKHKELKESFQKLHKQEKNWRSSYFNILEDSIQFDETIKNLIEENRIHQEYIISLENKLNKLLSSCNNITTSFHNNFMQLSNFDINTNNTNNNISTTLLKNYNEIINDYKQQIEILAEEKENLSTNLSITRHQQLQTTLKLEEMQNRFLFMEQARFEDLKILQNIKRETNSLKY